MENNPFVSDTYQHFWKKHFINAKESVYFNFIKKIAFYKVDGLPLYINFGKNNTNGITYAINHLATDFKNKVLVIYDVPSYSLSCKNELPNLKIKQIQQYAGHLINLEKYDSFDAFLNNRFNSKTRNKLKSYSKKLESNYKVSYKVYAEDIVEETYFNLMKQFRSLLKSRFDELGLENDILLKWDFYLDLIYPMILEKKALLNVVFVDEKVVAISLAFITDMRIIGAIKAFDVTYKNFSLGVIELLKLIEWGIESSYETFDFSKGNQDYKKRFIDESYHFNCHVLYDSKSLIATCIANSTASYFKFKQYLREKNVNTFFWRLKHKLKSSEITK